MSRRILSVLLVAFVCLLNLSDAVSMQRFILSVENQRTEGAAFLFDISLFNISESDLHLSESDFVLCFNDQDFIDDPSITATHPDEDVTDWYDYDPKIQNDSIIFIGLISPEVFNADDLANRTIIIPAMSERIVCSVKISGISNPDGESGLCWLNGDLFKSSISEYEAQPPYTIRFIEFEGSFREPPAFGFDGINTSVNKDTAVREQLRLYPQPAAEFVMVELPAHSETWLLEVIDMRGALKQMQMLDPLLRAPSVWTSANLPRVCTRCVSATHVKGAPSLRVHLWFALSLVLRVLA